MGYRGRVLVSALVGGLVAGSAAAQAPSTGPVAVYWISAATNTGMAGAGGGASSYQAQADQAQAQAQARAQAQQQAQQQQQQAYRPGLGLMVGAALPFGGLGAFGRRPTPPPSQSQSQSSYQSQASGYGAPGGGMPGMGGGVTKTLTLQLGSAQGATGAPEAAHFVPAALRAGESLPLVTPTVAPPEPREGDMPPQMSQRPKGRMLIYWGCGDHAQGPITIDFAKIGQGGPMPSMPMIAANPGRPPSAGRYTTYGQWPNEQARTSIPPDGSMVGGHTIKSNYSPDINFELGPNQDFLGPLNITSKDPTPMGGTRVAWDSVPSATGYFAWMFGAQDRGETIVMWSSGNAANMMGALTDYLPPAEVRRLVAQGAVMSPETTSCVVPSEVTKGAQFGMLQMIAYGDETDFADPPRPRAAGVPWRLKWTVKVRRKSTTTAMLGMPGGRSY
jgi:hypothetical protein